jgi:ATP-dependent DNA ligase
MIHTELCQLLGDWDGTTPTGGVWFEQKHDGWRALRFAGIDGQVRLWTRNGLPIEGTGHILWRLEQMEQAAGEPMMFDGEFVVDGTLDATKRWAEKGWRAGGEAGVFHLFDGMPLSAWQAGGDPTPLYERKKRLKALFDASAGDGWEWRPGSRGRDENGPPAVQLVEDGWAADAGEVIAGARRVWATGGEGLVLKDWSSPYRRTRSPAWAKVKRENCHRWLRAA